MHSESPTLPGSSVRERTDYIYRLIRSSKGGSDTLTAFVKGQIDADISAHVPPSSLYLAEAIFDPASGRVIHIAVTVAGVLTFTGLGSATTLMLLDLQGLGLEMSSNQNPSHAHRRDIGAPRPYLWH